MSFAALGGVLRNTPVPVFLEYPSILRLTGTSFANGPANDRWRETFTAEADVAEPSPHPNRAGPAPEKAAETVAH